MCKSCDDHAVNRRNVLGLAGLGIAAAAAAATVGVRAAAAADGPKTALTSDQALAALKDGNKRYVSQPQLCTLDLAKHRGELAEHQAPWATIIGCSDSRVPPELLFGGLGVGQLFVARNAGNLIDTAVIGTVEYGAAVLGSPLVVVLGHQRCGAVAQERDVPGGDRTDDRADPAGCDRRARTARRLRRQHDPGERGAHGRAADVGQRDRGRHGQGRQSEGGRRTL